MTSILDQATLCVASYSLLSDTAKIVEKGDVYLDLELLCTGAEITRVKRNLLEDCVEQIVTYAISKIAHAQGHHPARCQDNDIRRRSIMQLQQAPWKQQVQILHDALCLVAYEGSKYPEFEQAVSEENQIPASPPQPKR